MKLWAQKRMKSLRQWCKTLANRLNKSKEPAIDFCCKNCETTFTGHYCPNCGQSVREFDRPFGFVVYDFMGTVFAFDSRLIRTVWTITTKPGRLTADFLAGKRNRYTPPFKFYLFVSFIFFLLLSIGGQRSVDGINTNGKAVADSITSNISLSLSEDVKDEMDEAMKQELEESKVMIDSIAAISKSGLTKYVEEKMENSDDWSDTEKKLAENTLKVSRYPDLYINKFLQYLSWSLFLLMPVFALLMKLLYIRHGLNYMRHLIYAVNIHAFNFLILTIVLAANLYMPKQWAELIYWIIVLVPIYAWIGMRRFYQQSRRKTFLKLMILAGSYNFVLLSALIIVGYFAIMNI
ncbi:DUF3667 domain-containing protein [Puteibacter caeruleilacunae]|nr:DUF3667 domain-containing protein [Puteibacter caeruleilacunae]